MIWTALQCGLFLRYFKVSAVFSTVNYSTLVYFLWAQLAYISFSILADRIKCHRSSVYLSLMDLSCEAKYKGQDDYVCAVGLGRRNRIGPALQVAPIPLK